MRADKLVQHSVLSERKPISLRDVGGIEEDSPATLPASARPQSASSRQTQSECFWARLGVLACACAYGTSFVAVKMLDVVLTPAVSAFLRFGLAACFSLPILARARETISPRVHSVHPQYRLSNSTLTVRECVVDELSRLECVRSRVFWRAYVDLSRARWNSRDRTRIEVSCETYRRYIYQERT